MKFGTRLIHELKGPNKKYNCPTPNKQTHEFTRLIYNNGNSGIHEQKFNRSYKLCSKDL